MESSVNDILFNLSKSNFRNKFHLNEKMKLYVMDKGIDVIREHAYEIINKRLKPALIENDGKQTPMKQVHPVFIAEHATATCCRGCLYKWHKISMNKELSVYEVDYVVNVIIEWIKRECNL